MTTVISGSGSADFETVLPAAEGGTGTTAATGSGNVVLSASPTLTGTIEAAALTLTTPLSVASGGTGGTSGGGQAFPLGMIIPIASNLTGTHTIPDSGSVDSNGWMYCNGAAIPAGRSVS